jgi:flagellar hook-associated protein 3 FlgL
MAAVGELNSQISSGKRVSDFRGLSEGGNIERVLAFQGQLRESNNFLQNNKVISTRLLATSAAMDNIVKLAEDFRNTLIVQRSPGGNTLPMQEIVASTLGQIKGELNTNVAGRYIFAGSKTDLPAVGNITSSTNLNSEGKPTAYYYDGDSVNFTARITTTLEISYGTTADDPAFQQLIGAVHLAKRGNETSNNEDYEKALVMINDAISGLIALKTDAANDVSTIERVNTGHEDYRLLVEDAIGQVMDTDIPGATILLSVNQTVLQASFMAFSRISQLSLMNYLK